ncbi:MAG TPA: TIGR04063 family PEP-CTERM/XrtA system glycosyltransferase [Planctomycetota bacterium]|nr:TIGR04063 family PEP-CTERM/XrtA system glycosyltransferase [Planctomycetota bacterium]
MRVLHVLDHSIPLHSGYSFRTRSIVKQQQAMGIETYQLTSGKQGNGPNSKAEVDGLHFYRTAPPQGLCARIPALKNCVVMRDLRRRVAEVAREVKPDLIHAHSPCLTATAALPIAKRLGIPLVYEMRASWEDAAVDHGTCREGDLRYRLTRAMETRVLREANAVTTICEGLRAEIEARGIPGDRITVVPNAVDPDTFAYGRPADPALVERLGTAGKRVLGFIGSFYGYEGLRVLLDAMPRLIETCPDVRLLLVGGGYEEANLRLQAERLRLDGAVILVGRVPHAQVPDYYSVCDLMVYPRLDMRLTRIVTPLKPLEAMAQGCVVAASDIGGHREMVEDPVTGVLFPPNDPEALARTVGALISAPERWPALRAAARRYIEEERNWATSVARYLPVYERLLHGTNGKRGAR